jgi:hypothetical protein
MATYEIIPPKEGPILANPAPRIVRVKNGEVVESETLVAVEWRAMLRAPDYADHTLVFTTHADLHRWLREHDLEPSPSANTLTLYDDYSRQGNPQDIINYDPDLSVYLPFAAKSCESHGTSMLYSLPYMKTTNKGKLFHEYRMIGDVLKDDFLDVAFTPQSAETS